MRRLLFPPLRTVATRDENRPGLRRSRAFAGRGFGTAGAPGGISDALRWLVIGLGIGAGLRLVAERAQAPADPPVNPSGDALGSEAGMQIAPQPGGSEAFAFGEPALDAGDQDDAGGVPGVAGAPGAASAPQVRVYQEVPGPDGPIYVDSSGQVVSVSLQQGLP